MQIERGDNIVKVDIRNVKAFTPRKKLVNGNIYNEESHYYNLRTRKK